uniref:Uncharacterized protein n=1 Tax=uncultured bacterium BLR10 TaxID=506513 RepID=C0INT9_9BACT|nr:hypothetical protein AKSOIL_0196 [uncultured bacterium BLR10]
MSRRPTLVRRKPSIERLCPRWSLFSFMAVHHEVYRRSKN